MEDFLAFGDVFRFREAEYVYLSATQDITYAARIVGDRQASALKALCERAAVTGGAAAARMEDNVVYCFVVLKTREYFDKLAHYGRPANDQMRAEEKICSLIKEDRDELKEAILGSNGIPEELKDLIRTIAT